MDSIEVDIDGSQGQRFERLEDRQRQLLAQLDDLRRTPILDLATELAVHELEQEYNRLADEKEELVPRKGIDPINVLPNELVVEIFKMVASDTTRISFPAPLILVSRKWTCAACSIPSLWTYVDFSGSDALAKGITSLELSGSLHIEVHINLPYGDWLQVADQVVSQAYRIETLTVLEHAKEEAFKVLSDFSSLPIIQGFSIQGLDRAGWSRDELKAIPWFRTSENNTQDHTKEIYRWKKFDSIFTDEITDAVIDRWSASPALRSLTIKERSIGSSPFTNSLPKYSTIRNVTQLVYRADEHSSGATILPFILPFLPNLIYFTFDSLATAFPETLGTLHVAKNLQHLLVFLRTEPEVSLSASKLEALLQKPAIHHLSNVSIHLNSPLVELEQGGADVAGAHFYRCLQHFLPSVGRLELSNMSITEESHNFIRAVSKLSSLRLHHCTLKSPLLMASQELSDFEWHYLVPYLGAPITFTHPLRRLELVEGSFTNLSETTIAEWKSPLQSFGPLSGPQPYEMIRHLTITGYVQSMTTFGPLPRLHTLEFRQGAYEYWKGGHPLWAGDILELVALRPLEYPCLTELRLLNTFFEWDLVLVLLERRNISIRSDVAPIIVICTDYLLPYAILSPLVSLLQGRFPVRDRLARYSVEQVGAEFSNAS